MTTATTYDTVITHARTEPLRHVFSNDARSWLVDLDELPLLPRGLRWLASFEPRDHLGDPDRSLRANVDAFAAEHGIDLTGGHTLMLANARALGHVVNPISVHWCYTADDRLAAVVAEVHNTYGDRHAYLLTPDIGGQIDEDVDKEMYVSPFNPVDGHYRITVSAPTDQVRVTVTLHRDGHPPFVATLKGTRERHRPLLVSAVTTATASLRTSALIRYHGIRLFLRGLRIEPRPVHPRQKAV